MESNHEQLSESLREAARAEVAPWTDFPPTPAWYPPACGVWVASFVLVASTFGDWLRVAGFLVLLGCALGFGAWYRRFRGAMPVARDMPPRFRPAARLFTMLALPVVVAAGALAFVMPWVGALVALVGITAVVAWYEKAYAEAARLTREDLA